MDSTLPLVSLVCAAAADEDRLQQFHSALYRMLRPLDANYRFEIIYVASEQHAATSARIEALAQLDPRIRVAPPVASGNARQVLHAGLADPSAAMVVLLDIAVHPSEVVPQLLELAQGPAAVIECNNWQSSPLAAISYSGATVFVVGVLLAVWFAVQGMVAPGSVWFSWCYLIVLLHILGGSMLYALGKVGALATHILSEVKRRPADQGDAFAAPQSTRQAA